MISKAAWESRLCARLDSLKRKKKKTVMITTVAGQLRVCTREGHNVLQGGSLHHARAAPSLPYSTNDDATFSAAKG
jgi:hypothetical protein